MRILVSEFIDKGDFCHFQWYQYNIIASSDSKSKSSYLHFFVVLYIRKHYVQQGMVPYETCDLPLVPALVPVILYVAHSDASPGLAVTQVME